MEVWNDLYLACAFRLAVGSENYKGGIWSKKTFDTLFSVFISKREWNQESRESEIRYMGCPEIKQVDREHVNRRESMIKIKNT